VNKILVGVLVGAVLGAIDGAGAWFTPEVRDQMLSIIIGSTFKGVLAGVAAGWYARRVSSVSKGIVFGFVVGLVLAFITAALTPNHYWFEIMLPGSVLGGVIGWATQRYGRPGTMRHSAAAAMLLVLLFVGAPAFANDGHDHAKPTSNAAFEKLKSLHGTWTANMMTPTGEKAIVDYRVTAGGSVVMETMFVGAPEEMINMYTMDGDALIATHYCSGQNQPILRLNASASSEDELVFDFVKVTGKNTDSYINGVRIKFGSDGKAVEEWSSTGEGAHMRLFLNTRR
jgi:hypothetical protein